MLKNIGIALGLGLTSISLFPALVNAEPNLDLPRSEIVINQDIDNNGKSDLIIASYFIRTVLVPKYDATNTCHQVSGKFVRYTLFANGEKTGKDILEISYGTSLASYWMHKLILDRDIDGDGQKELSFYMGDDTSQARAYLFLKPDGVRVVNLGVTDLPGASLNETFDLQLFGGNIIARWDQSAKLWKSQNNQYGWVVGDCVEIRESPNARSKIVSMISSNEILPTIQPQINVDWVAVKFAYDKIGWINTKNFSFTSPVSVIKFDKP
ncbi:MULTISPECIES: SH3 domain-containing protein [Pseudanabaena]|jgi:hypothetical protein|uniref:SH3 domain-containing protein n=1 Tax=Pseudanabaena TaxID=1152 RepID=UPI0024796FA1|nr:MULTISPECIES: SH3 domain-containing protein [Pseudanabaena]MEA5485766.1 SH3 domain-containing protein [Pseudanabaena sp. CCNP1317]WGS72343.1 SH3 domain-containing protein [Pseudanabaena galeata CCNP1313]